MIALVTTVFVASLLVSGGDPEMATELLRAAADTGLPEAVDLWNDAANR